MAEKINIRAMREKHRPRLSQDAVAFALRVVPVTYRRWEKENYIPDPQHRANFLRLMKIGLDRYLEKQGR